MTWSVMMLRGLEICIAPIPSCVTPTTVHSSYTPHADILSANVCGMELLA